MHISCPVAGKDAQHTRQHPDTTNPRVLHHFQLKLVGPPPVWPYVFPLVGCAVLFSFINFPSLLRAVGAGWLAGWRVALLPAKRTRPFDLATYRVVVVVKKKGKRRINVPMQWLFRSRYLQVCKIKSPRKNISVFISLRINPGTQAKQKDNGWE